MAGAESSLLLALPDPCLLRVLQCCAADDYRSLFNAARAHSRLHQAAVVALRSIKKQVSPQQISGIMVYLGKHGQHLNSLDLRGDGSLNLLCHLPQQLRLSSLQFRGFSLQLQPANGLSGVLGAAAAVAALKQLRLDSCRVNDAGAAAALAATLSQLPAGLEHLSISGLHGAFGTTWWQHRPIFPAGVLQQLPHLTYLELGGVFLVGPDKAHPALQQLQGLTGLAGLKLISLRGVVTCSMLAGMRRLTCLELLENMELEPGVLAGMTQLQHLCVGSCQIRGGAAGVAQLLAHMQPLQQLTHLSMGHSLRAVEGGNPPASAYAALTASSKLQHLQISSCTLPAGMWWHLFPAGRQLPNLQFLDISGVRQPTGELAQAPEGSRLVSGCPGLQSLHIRHLRSPELAIVQGLSALQTLAFNGYTTEGWQAVCRLTGLRGLSVVGFGNYKEGALLQLTQLWQLTALHSDSPIDGFPDGIDWAGGEEPVWQRLLRLHLDHPDPGVAQQAAAALADSQ